MGLSPEMRAEFKAKLEVGFKEDKEKREKYKDKYAPDKKMPSYNEFLFCVGYVNEG